MILGGSQKQSADSARGSARPRSRTSSRDSYQTRSARAVSADRVSQRSARFSNTDRGQRDRVASSAAASHRRDSSDRGSTIGGGGERATGVRRSGSNNSTAFTKTSNHEGQNGTPRRGSSGRHSYFNLGSRCSSAHAKPLSREELLALLMKNTRLSDIRPDVYRLDLSRKDDLRFLYETQHRVDPELVPVTKRISHAMRQMNRSHIFDTAPAPTQPAAATPVKRNSDGLGSLARFVLGSEARNCSPVRRRTPRSCSASATTLRLFGGYADNSVSPPPQPRTGMRQVPTHPADKLGPDFLARDPLSEDMFSRRGVRTIKAVEAFEAAQPKLTLPPRKQTSRVTDAMRSHSAASDSDIFGVRRRRENMGQRPRSASAHSNDPYGSEHGDEMPQKNGFPKQGTNLRVEVRRNGDAAQRSTEPFGGGEEEVPRNKGTPTRHHLSRRSSSLTSRTNGAAPVFTRPIAPNKWDGRRSPYRCGSGRESQRMSAAADPYASTAGVTAEGTTSMVLDQEQYNITPLVSPRQRTTGRARVPGYSITASNVIFGGGQVLESPQRSPRKTQLQSSQMRNILTWQ